MIDVKELRVGNYVTNCANIDAIEVHGLNKAKNSPNNGVHESVLCRYWNPDRELPFFYENPQQLNPIPLTEEWLLKFGATKTSTSHHSGGVFQCYRLGDYNFCADGSLSIYTSDGELDIAENIKYVHQLQNLYFALTGKELELVKEPA